MLVCCFLLMKVQCMKLIIILLVVFLLKCMWIEGFGLSGLLVELLNMVLIWSFVLVGMKFGLIGVQVSCQLKLQLMMLVRIFFLLFGYLVVKCIVLLCRCMCGVQLKISVLCFGVKDDEEWQFVCLGVMLSVGLRIYIVWIVFLGGLLWKVMLIDVWLMLLVFGFGVLW